MKIMFLGSVVTPELAENLSGTSIAGNKMQYCVLRELGKYTDIDISVVTVKSRASFPGDKVVFEKRDTINLGSGVNAYCASYCNIPLIKQIWHTLSIKHEAEKCIKREGTPDVIMAFNLFPQTGTPLLTIGEKYHIPVVSLLADLPIDDAAKRSKFMSGWRKVFDRITANNIAKCNNIIALNQNAVDIYNPNANSIIVDGGIDINEYTAVNEVISPNRKNIVYAGSLVKYNGIKALINMMDLIDDAEISLDIYGDGDLREFVEKESQRTERINYHGRVSSDKLNSIYQNAWLLINPRPVSDPISQVTFPSKMFEYLISGTPVLSTRLSGFSKEYESVMFFAENDSAEGLAKSVNYISSLTQHDLNDKAKKAQEFVLSNKTWEKQCKKIKAFLETLC